MSGRTPEFLNCGIQVCAHSPLFAAIFEKLHDKVANEQMLSFSDKLPVGSAGVILQTVLMGFPNRQRNRHSPSLLDHQPCCFKASFIIELRQDIGCVDAREFTYLFFTEPFSNYHSSVHCYFLLFFGRLATSISLNLSYCSCVST